jgi:hypothetical protein
MVGILKSAAMKLEVGTYERTLYLCEIYGFLGSRHMDQAAECEGWDWDDVCGKLGCLLTEASENYNYDTMYHRISEVTSCDGMCWGAQGSVLMLHIWGDVKAAQANMDRTLQAAYRCIADPVPSLSQFCAGLFLPWALHLLGRDTDAIVLMRKLKLDWESVDSSIAVWVTNLDLLGVDEGTLLRPVDISWHLKAMWMLINEEEQPQQVLPSGKEMAMEGVVKTPSFHPGHLSGFTSVVWAALAHEKFGRVDEALECAAAVIEPDQTKGGEVTQWAVSMAHRCRGRLLARRGEMSAAKAAFEVAAAVAASRGYRCLEAMSVREMASFVVVGLEDGSSNHEQACASKLASMTKHLALDEAELDRVCRLARAASV